MPSESVGEDWKSGGRVGDMISLPYSSSASESPRYVANLDDMETEEFVCVGRGGRNEGCAGRSGGEDQNGAVDLEGKG